MLSDEILSERQKQVLLEIYDSFCRENGSSAAAAVPAPPTGPAVEPPAAPPPPGTSPRTRSPRRRAAGATPTGTTPTPPQEASA